MLIFVFFSLMMIIFMSKIFNEILVVLSYGLFILIIRFNMGYFVSKFMLWRGYVFNCCVFISCGKWYVIFCKF